MQYFGNWIEDEALKHGKKGKMTPFFHFKGTALFFPLKLRASTRKAKTLLYEWPLTVGTKHSLPFFLKQHSEFVIPCYKTWINLLFKFC